MLMVNFIFIPYAYPMICWCSVYMPRRCSRGTAPCSLYIRIRRRRLRRRRSVRFFILEKSRIWVSSSVQHVRFSGAQKFCVSCWNACHKARTKRHTYIQADSLFELMTNKQRVVWLCCLLFKQTKNVACQCNKDMCPVCLNANLDVQHRFACWWPRDTMFKFAGDDLRRERLDQTTGVH